MAVSGKQKLDALASIKLSTGRGRPVIALVVFSGVEGAASAPCRRSPALMLSDRGKGAKEEIAWREKKAGLEREGPRCVEWVA